MSQFLVTRIITMTTTLLIYLMIGGVFFVADISTVESRKDLTTVTRVICSIIKLNADDPYFDTVHDLLDDITTTAPDDPNYRFAKSDTTQALAAYAYGDCNTQLDDPDDCLDCLSECTEAFQRYCDSAIGAQIFMRGCYMRYEPYRFFQSTNHRFT